MAEKNLFFIKDFNTSLWGSACSRISTNMVGKVITITKDDEEIEVAPFVSYNYSSEEHLLVLTFSSKYLDLFFSLPL